nr:atherin-like [Aegilops tauschii subsp. strangulata]
MGAPQPPRHARDPGHRRAAASRLPREPAAELLNPAKSSTAARGGCPAPASHEQGERGPAAAAPTGLCPTELTGDGGGEGRKEGPRRSRSGRGFPRLLPLASPPPSRVGSPCGRLGRAQPPLPPPSPHPAPFSPSAAADGWCQAKPVRATAAAEGLSSLSRIRDAAGVLIREVRPS